MWAQTRRQKFDTDDKVIVQDQKTKRWSIEATIVKNHGERSYVVNDGTKEFARNRKFIRGVPPNDSQDQDGQSRELPNHAINQNEHDRASNNEKSNPVAIPHPSRRSKRKTIKVRFGQRSLTNWRGCSESVLFDPSTQQRALSATHSAVNSTTLFSSSSTGTGLTCY